jgi:YDG domain/Galactose oxidase, central domain
MKRVPSRVWVGLGILCFAGILQANGPQLLISKWTLSASLSAPRASSVAVMLADGSILFTGGENSGTVLQSTEILDVNGNISLAADMNVPRSRHVAVLLNDGRVLVGGGTTSGGGTTNSAEIYDSSANTWTQISPMTSARANATAALLQDGRVLIAGGDNSGTPNNTIEVYDPASGGFSFAGTLSSPRTQHAMLVLQDGRVLIVGGFDGNNPLATSDIFDPTSGNITAGPSLATGRYSMSATTLMNGQVAVIGGAGQGSNGTVDLASIEIFDPMLNAFDDAGVSLTTAREGHQAFLLPNNNNVLIVGGTSSGTVLASAELLTPTVSTSTGSWTYSVSSTGSLATARAGASGSANQTNGPITVSQKDGIVYVAGGNDPSGNVLSSGEEYGYATVQTDQSDFAPGTTVTISGAGFTPGETVSITLVESPLIDTHGPYSVIADANGNFVDTSFATDIHDANVRFWLSAVGSQSGLQAQNTFTDSKPNTVTLNPTSVTVLAGSNAVYTVTVNFNGNGNSCTSPLSIAFSSPAPVGVTSNFNPASLTSTGGNANSTLTLSTTNTGPQSGRTQPGAFPFTVTAGNGAGCQAGTATGNGTLIVAGNATTLSVSGYPSPATAGTAQNFTVTALDSNGNTAIGYRGTVSFASTDGQATLPTNYTFTAADNGVHTFSATLKTVGTQAITAMDTTAGTINGTQSGIVVNSAPTAKLLVSGYPSPVTAGTSNSFTVTAEDAFNNVTTGYTGTVHFTSSDAAAALPANYTFTSGTGNKDNGTHTFNATLNTAGAQSITAIDTVTATITGTQAGIVVNSATVNSTTTVSSSSNPSIYGTSVTFTATVTRSSGTNTPTGTVAIKDGATTICTTGNLTGSNGTASASCAVSTLSVTGSPHSITAVYGGDSNFNGSTSSALVQTVTQKALTVTGISANNRQYDGTTTATLNTGSATLVGVASGDTVTLSTAGATGTFSDKNVGTGKTVTITGLTFGGASAGSYTLTQPTATADITAVALTVSIIGNPAKVYDGNTSATLTAANFSLSGTVGSESFSVTKTSGAYNTKDVATAMTVTTTLVASDFVPGPGTLATNYTLPSSASGAGQITPKTLTASIMGNPTKAYDGTNTATLTSANFSLAGLVTSESITVTQTAGTYNSKDVLSANTVSANLAAGDFTTSAGTLLSNYSLPTSANGAGQISPKTLTASIIGNPTKTYDGTTGATLTSANFSLVSLVTGESISVTQTAGTYNSKDVLSANTVTASLAAGDFTVSSGTLLSNYTPPTSASGSGQITPKTLTAAITGNPTKPYDGNTTATLAPANYSLSGLISGESITVAQSAGTYNSKDVLSANSVTANLGPADFTAGSGTLLTNYTLPTTASGAGQITAKTLTASIIGNPTKTYDGTTSATLTSANFSLLGLVSGESITVTQTVGAYNSKDVATASTVTANLTAGDFTAAAGTLTSNYVLPTSASGAGHINKANATINVLGYSTTYDGDPRTATGTAVGVQSENLAGLDLAGTTHTNAGTYNDSWTFTDATGNYNDATGSVSDSIAKANAVVNVTPYSVTYDGNAHIATGTATGVKGESLAGLDLSGTTHTHAGNYTDFWAFTDVTGNYNDANSTVLDVIAKANAVINVTPYGVTYDGNAHTATGSATGVQGESLAGLDLGGTAHTHAGNYTDPWTFTDVTGNYNNGSGTTSDVIAKANAVFSVTPYSVTYDAVGHTATGTATGVLGDSLSGLDLTGTIHTNAGDYPADPWSFIDVTGDYNNANGTTHDYIDKATAIIIVNAYHVTYDANPHTASGTATGVGGSDLSAGLNLSGTSHTNAGDYPSDSWSFSGGTNYNDASGTVHDVIDKANAALNVTPYHVTYGGNPHTATGTATGVGGVDLSSGFTLTATMHTDAGDYPSDAWTFSGGTNYNNASGTVHDVIDRASAVISVNAYNVVYSGTAHTATGTAIGVQGESLSGLTLSGTTHTNAGSYTDSWTFTDVTGNYNNAAGMVNDNIAKATAVVSVSPYNVTYNGAPHTAMGSASGVLSEPLSGLNLSATTHTNAGSYNDTWMFTDSMGNYNNSTGTVSDVISKANATINVMPYSVSYDGNPHTATGTVKGVLNESLSGLSLTGTTHTNPGDYPLDGWTFTDSTGNYNNASGTVHDLIGYGTCNISIGPGQVILPPINSDGTSVYQRKGGSTIPVKFRVCSASGASISNSSTVFAGTGGTLTMLSTVRGTIDNVNETSGTDIPDAAFRWDSSGQQWIFNMATSNLSSGSTYAFRINLAYGNITFVVGVK